MIFLSNFVQFKRKQGKLLYFHSHAQGKWETPSLLFHNIYFRHTILDELERQIRTRLVGASKLKMVQKQVVVWYIWPIIYLLRKMSQLIFIALLLNPSKFLSANRSYKCNYVLILQCLVKLQYSSWLVSLSAIHLDQWLLITD